VFDLIVGLTRLKRYTKIIMDLTVVLTSFELGQLYAILGPTGLGKLSPELRRKLKTAFEDRRLVTTPDPYHYATEETES